MSIKIDNIETYKGLVLQTGLETHSDMGYDTDYYALVWDIQDMKPKEIRYSGTHPGNTIHGTASVDAHPLIKECFEVYRHNIKRNMVINEYAYIERAYIGDTIKVVAGRKAPKGFIGEIVEAKETQYGFRYRIRDNKTEHVAWSRNIEVIARPMTAKPNLESKREYPNISHLPVLLRII